jgi:hypothetical protein
MSKGLERYKVVLRFPRPYAAARGSPKTVSSFRLPVGPGFPVTSLADGMGNTSRRLTFHELAAPPALSDLTES